MNPQNHVKRPETDPKAPATDSQMAEKEKDAETGPNLYAGNIAYIKTDVKGNPAHVYAMIIARFCNDHEVPEMLVQTYPVKAGFNLKVGDFVAFEAKRLRESVDKDGNPMKADGVQLYKPSGIGRDPFKLTLVRRAGNEAKPEVKGEIRSESLRAKLASISPFVAKLLGVKTEE